MYFSTMAQQGIDLKLDKWEALFYAKMQCALLCTQEESWTFPITDVRLDLTSVIGKISMQE